MNQPAIIVSVVGVIACMVLVARSGSLQAMSRTRRVQIAALWLVIIAALAWALDGNTPHNLT